MGAVGLFFLLVSFLSCCLATRFCEFVFRSPYDELLIGDNIWRSDIVYEFGTSLGSNVGFDKQTVLSTVDAYCPVSICRAVEGSIAKCLEIVGQQVACIQIDVVGEVGQVVMVDTSRNNGLVAVDVVEPTVFKGDVVARQQQCVVLHLVGTVQCTDMRFSVEH